MIDAISELRQKELSSLEAIGYLMGADPAQLSRYLKGTRSTTLTNYLRIARALGIEAGWYWKKPTSAMPLQACFLVRESFRTRFDEPTTTGKNSLVSAGWSAQDSCTLTFLREYYTRRNQLV